MLKTNKDFTFVVHSYGERTESECIRLILEQNVPAEHVHVVKGLSSFDFLKKALQIGKNAELTWSVFIDADLLLRDGSLSLSARYLSTLAPDVFLVSFFVYNKIFGKPSKNGNFFIRTETIPKLLEKLSLVDPESVEPINDLCGLMIREKLRTTEVKGSLIGFYMLDQHYRDIYRKCYVEGRKHDCWDNSVFAYCRKLGFEDDDLKFAIKGYTDGFIAPDTSPRQIVNFNVDINPVYEKYHVKEKPADFKVPFENVDEYWKVLKANMPTTQR